MPVLLYANFVDTELQASIEDTDIQVVVPVAAAQLMPAVSVGADSAFHLVLFSGTQPPEILRVIENPQTGILDVERAQEFSTARGWKAGTRARLTVTAEFLNQLPSLALAKDNDPLLGGGASSNDKIPSQLAVKTYADTGLALKANLASPTFTGVPAGPTAAGGTSTTQLATTAFVQNEISEAISGVEGEITGFAPINSPVLTGDPTAPTPAPGDNDTSIATTAYVLAAITAAVGGALPGVFSTGDIKYTVNPTPVAGWILCDDGTIGSASSGATNRANADTETLFKLIWNSCTNAFAPVVGGRGASADDDWIGNRAITLPRLRGRVLGVAGAGAGLTTRTNGQFLGTETHTLTLGEMPNHTHRIAAAGNNQNDPVTEYGELPYPNIQVTGNRGPGNDERYGLRGIDLVPTFGNTSFSGSDEAHPNMQPTVFLRAWMKL